MGLARAIAKLFNLPYLDVAGGLQEGQVAVLGPAAYQAAAPTGAAPHLLPVAGINRMAGVIGGAGTQRGEEISCQRLGYAKLLVSSNVTTALGGQVIADSAPNLGNVRQRVPYSASALVLGQFEEARQVGTSPELIEGEVRPTWLELVRQVTGSQPSGTPIGNNVTRWLGAPGVALSQAPIALYRSRFGGETVRSLGATLAIRPADGETVQVTIARSQDGGLTFVDTPVTCTMTGPQSAAEDLTRLLVLARGDVLGLKVVSFSTPAAGLTVTFDVT
jgi:hypothetical protein